MHTYFLVGPNSSLNIFSTLDKNITYEVIGDGKNYIDCSNIQLSNYSNVVIYAHGNRYDLYLCKEAILTRYQLESISRSNPMDFEIFAFHSQATGENSVSLSFAPWSTLITSTAEEEITQN